MKKSELLKTIDQELLDKLFGFCYTRTKDRFDKQGKVQQKLLVLPYLSELLLVFQTKII